MEVLVLKSERSRVKRVKKIIESTGNQIASVWFRKRSDGTLRKMAFRLHVTNPTYVSVPRGDSAKPRKVHDYKNMQITVLDVNTILRAKSGKRKGKICGRGDYRTIPLNNVVRLCVRGKKYKITAG